MLTESTKPHILHKSTNSHIRIHNPIVLFIMCYILFFYLKIGQINEKE